MLLTLVAGFAIVQEAQHARAELVSSMYAVPAGQSFLAGIVIRTDPGWHVYWKNPGDSGQATSVEWKLPPRWKVEPLRFPTPSRFNEQGMVTYGYEGVTLLLTRITTPADEKGRFFKLQAKVSWLACKEACVPGSANLTFDFAVERQPREHRMWKPVLDAADKSLPQPLPGWTFEAREIDGGFRLKVKPATPLEESTHLPAFYPLDEGTLDHSAPQRFLRLEDGSFLMALVKSKFLDKRPEKLRGLLVAPKGTKWHEDIDAVLVDVPVIPKDGNSQQGPKPPQ